MCLSVSLDEEVSCLPFFLSFKSHACVFAFLVDSPLSCMEERVSLFLSSFSPSFLRLLFSFVSHRLQHPEAREGQPHYSQSRGSSLEISRASVSGSEAPRKAHGQRQTQGNSRGSFTWKGSVDSPPESSEETSQEVQRRQENRQTHVSKRQTEGNGGGSIDGRKKEGRE